MWHAWERRGKCTGFLVGKPEEKRPLRKPRRGCEDLFRAVRLVWGVEWIQLAQDGAVSGLLCIWWWIWGFWCHGVSYCYSKIFFTLPENLLPIFITILCCILWRDMSIYVLVSAFNSTTNSLTWPNASKQYNAIKASELEKSTRCNNCVCYRWGTFATNMDIFVFSVCVHQPVYGVRSRGSKWRLTAVTQWIEETVSN
jgi:hypothetical protein